MAKIMKVLFLLVLVLVAIGGALHWLDQPRRTTGRFAGHMYHERYDEAAAMLQPPSALVMESDGGLVLVDRKGREVPVLEVQLPFKVGGHDNEREHDFVMTALGPATDGILHDPAVALYLSVVGDEVAIEFVDLQR